eukprot:CAMPEP_0196641258 /NCGR_PEP_ID=MMETSP1085-20130531/3356_1 /TAXON_ID=41879 ORGANISM="Pycnococcus sp, Strain CCMP1998" /NCGR_SAMPLE_ID=MMETSP1085 /ASSEMBLY_ACC=CAM_ASM_000807 /LENGTH=471 /DNA_ID=CAMNT_0041970477 /DNA_START=24 /DNA_END=1437 /DNA_ORIENTATION=-
MGSVGQEYKGLVLAREHGVLGDRAGTTRLSYEMLDAVLLVHELLLALHNLLAEVVVDLKVIADLVAPVPGGLERHAVDQTLLDSVRVAVRAYGHAEAVSLLSGHEQGPDVVGDGDSGGGSRRPSPLLDHGGSPGLHDGGELLLKPVLVVDHLLGRLSQNGGVHEVRHLGGGVVAPDRDVLDRTVMAVRLNSELGPGSVLVQPGERMEVLPLQVRGVLHGDESVGVARVANNDDLAVRVGDLVQGLALHLEDLAVQVKEVGPLHSRSPWLGADEDGPVHVPEGLLGLGADPDLPEKRVARVLELHGDALDGILGPVTTQKVEGDGLVVAEGQAGGDLEQKVVGNLPRGARDGDPNGGLPVGRGGRLGVLELEVVAEGSVAGSVVGFHLGHASVVLKVLALPPVEDPTLLADMVVAVLRTCTFLAEVAAALPAALAEVMVVFIVGLVSLASCRVAFSSPPALVLFFVDRRAFP